MINSVGLENFKSFREAIVPFRPLTVLSGLNNCGKSSIIQSLRMFERSFSGVSPYIDGHGSLKELRSKLASPHEKVKIELDFNNGRKESLILHENDKYQNSPKFSPLVSFISADRLGPQTYLPLSNIFNSFPKIGDRGEYVYEFIDKLSFAVVPETINHANSQGLNLPMAIKGWLSEISPNVEFEYQLNPKVDIAQATFDEFRPKNVGFGISHALPIIATVLGYTAKTPAQGWVEDWGVTWDNLRTNNTLIIIENPECHLHPRGQTAMGMLLALAASHGIQVLVETHSDHLIDGIRLACKRKLIKNSDVFFHYLTKESNNAETTFQTPSINEAGKLDFWPNGFFDQSMKIKAQLARR